MLRMYLLQIWFNLTDEGVEDAIYDSYAMRKFMGINFMDEQVPDATTLLKFRHLIEENKIGEQLFRAINYVLEQAGCMMKGGTIVDATIINAPSSTKNAEGKRDSKMHQKKKGNEWRFGTKCHIGVDAGSGLVHTITATAANIHDISETSKLIREDDEIVYGDSGYLGIKNRKSSARCKVEHTFRITKGDFGYRKVVYRGIAKNLNRLNIMFACANLLMCKSETPSFACKGITAPFAGIGQGTRAYRVDIS